MTIIVEVYDRQSRAGPSGSVQRLQKGDGLLHLMVDGQQNKAIYRFAGKPGVLGRAQNHAKVGRSRSLSAKRGQKAGLDFLGVDPAGFADHVAESRQKIARTGPDIRNHVSLV